MNPPTNSESMDGNIAIQKFIAAITAASGDVEISYEYPGYFEIYWGDRVYALRADNGVWDYQSALVSDIYDTWEDQKEVIELPLTATTDELIEFVKTNILK